MKTQDKKRRRAMRTRYKLRQVGSPDLHRLSVSRSSQHLDLQLIDDKKGHTLFAVSTKQKEFRGKRMPSKEAASLIGQKMAEKIKEAGISALLFDKGSSRYHKGGCLDLIASAVRSVGIRM